MKKISHLALMFVAFYVVLGTYFGMVLLPDMSRALASHPAPLNHFARILVHAPRRFGMIPGALLVTFSLLPDLCGVRRWIRLSFFIVLGTIPFLAIFALSIASGAYGIRN